MNRKNNKILKKIENSMLAQFPPASLTKARNAWINEYKVSHKRNRQVYECLLHNHECKGKAINSHSIPKKNLRMMSNNNEVNVLKDDSRNPFKLSLNTSNIKSTQTFSGFCKYHDSSLFQKIENKDTIQYDSNDMFFLSYRALAKEYSDYRELVEQYSWMLDNWNSEKKRRLDIEYAMLHANKMKRLKIFFKARVSDKRNVRKKLRECHIHEQLLRREIEKFNVLINREEIFESHHIIFQNEKQIAFSLAYDIQVKNKTIFLYLISLPQKDGSLMILTCKKEDYEYIKYDREINELFSGNEILINNFLNQFKEKIAIDKTNVGSKYADPFFLEWNIPLATIPYFKHKSNNC